MIVHYNRSEDKAEEVAGYIESRGKEVLLVRGEVSEARKSGGWSARSTSTSRADVLVNNVGPFVEKASLDEITEELWDGTVDVNLKSVYLCSQAVLPLMRRRGSGKIVNISSVATSEGSGSIAYSAAEGGVRSLTRAMARELASEGISVNAVSPGCVDTLFHDKFTSKEPPKR